MPESYDVVIVGAGPAGLRCAEILGNSNLSVLLIEKRNIIDPRYQFVKIKNILKYKQRQELMLKIFNFAHFALIQDALFKVFIALMKTQWFQRYFGD